MVACWNGDDRERTIGAPARRLRSRPAVGGADALWRAAERGEDALPEPGADVNLHAHTFFSYNAYGYSPSKFAWLARKAGLAVAGIVDFDVLDGVDEFSMRGG